MKNMMFGFIVLFALFIFGFAPAIVGSAHASPLIAQVQQSANTEKTHNTPTPPTPAEPSEDQQKAESPKEPPAALAKQSKEDSSGPYDMEAMKAFNRALYGS